MPCKKRVKIGLIESAMMMSFLPNFFKIEAHRFYDKPSFKNNQIQNNYWIWLIVYIGIGLVISFLVPFPISFGIALVVFFLLNTARMHIALKRRGQVFETSRSLREHEKVITEDKKYKNHQGFDA